MSEPLKDSYLEECRALIAFIKLGEVAYEIWGIVTITERSENYICASGR
jgi:hypothetical protein